MAPSDTDTLTADRAKALDLVPVSREITERLDRFVEIFLAWQARTNLVASSTLPTLWTRHIADSLQFLSIAPEARRWVDLGSGGGFPGLIIATALSGQPNAQVHLVESTNKKADFLRAAAQHLGVPAIVHPVRIEQFAETFEEPIDVVCARALAPMEKLLGLAYPLLKRGAQGIFPKGQDVDAELTQASKYWNIEAEMVPSRTDARSRIVVVHAAQPKTRAKRISDAKSRG